MNQIKIIAEIGWNHMGDLKLAEKMIHEAKKSGADFAKFQTWQVKNLKSGPWDTDGRRDIYKKAELTKENYSKLKSICKYYKINFLTSLFNPRDYELIGHLKLKTIKIPSPENRNEELLKFCKKNFENIFLSTGAASLKEIKKSFELIKNNNTTLMHCVSSYPCDDHNTNIQRIEKLKFICKNVGLSDHSADILSSIISLSMGITLIEKHFTIDNNLPGRDNKFALLPKDIKQLKNCILRYEQMRKINNKFIPQEIEVRKKYSGRWSN